MSDNPNIRSLGGGIASNSADGAPSKIYTVLPNSAAHKVSIRITHTDKAGVPVEVTLSKQMISKDDLIPLNGVDITYDPGNFSITSDINLQQNESLHLGVSQNGVMAYDIEGDLFKPVNLGP